MLPPPGRGGRRVFGERRIFGWIFGPKNKWHRFLTQNPAWTHRESAPTGIARGTKQQVRTRFHRTNELRHRGSSGTGAPATKIYFHMARLSGLYKWREGDPVLQMFCFFWLIKLDTLERKKNKSWTAPWRHRDLKARHCRWTEIFWKLHLRPLKWWKEVGMKQLID